jgi:hypothetical protein
MLLMIGSVSAASGNWTNDNSTDTLTVTPENVSAKISVNQFGEELENFDLKYFDNASTGSRTFDLNASGNVSEIIDFPQTVTLFQNQSSSFPLIGNVESSQRFGEYNGSLNVVGTGNSRFKENASLQINVFDNIEPSIDEVSIGDVMSTENVSWSVEASDNLNVSSVSGEVLRETTVSEDNETVRVNETVKSFSFEKKGGLYDYTFGDTGSMGQYYVNVSVNDTSGNKVSSVYPFKVNGLDSISVLSENFVFDTIRPKESTGFELVNSSIEGKELSFELKSLSYGGNESVSIGVRPPGAGSAEVLDVNSSRGYSEAGVYELVLVHSGNDELEGTHRVSGEVKVRRPSQHVGSSVVSSVFSGTVKNLDKPEETCQRFAEFNGCIGYSLDGVRSLFDGEFGINDSGTQDFVYMIGRIPTSDVEGSSEWGSETSLTLGEYNESEQTIRDQEARIEVLEGSRELWKNSFLFLFVVAPVMGGGLFIWYMKIGRYMSFGISGRKRIEKSKVKNPEEGLQ